jgi:hypothetical protein
MGLFTKKADPITSKARALEQQMAALESEIKRLNRRLEKPAAQRPAATTNGHDHDVAHAPMRSTATPHNPLRGLPRRMPARDPIFESVDQAAVVAAGSTPAHFNDLGVRKYDLPGAWRKLIGHFRGPSTHNPKLVSYLAAGSIRGLRPLRYEKRVARNRFVMMSIFFLGILYWLTSVFWRHR